MDCTEYHPTKPTTPGDGGESPARDAPYPPSISDSSGNLKSTEASEDPTTVTAIGSSELRTVKKNAALIVDFHAPGIFYQKVFTLTGNWKPKPDDASQLDSHVPNWTFSFTIKSENTKNGQSRRLPPQNSGEEDEKDRLKLKDVAELLSTTADILGYVMDATSTLDRYADGIQRALGTCVTKSGFEVENGSEARKDWKVAKMTYHPTELSPTKLREMGKRAYELTVSEKSLYTYTEGLLPSSLKDGFSKRDRSTRETAMFCAAVYLRQKMNLAGTQFKEV